MHPAKDGGGRSVPCSGGHQRQNLKYSENGESGRRRNVSSAWDWGVYSKCNGKPLQEVELVNFVIGLEF